MYIDHGKTTLYIQINLFLGTNFINRSDRLLEITNTIRKSEEQDQYLDKLQVERERGITVKAQSVVMFYKYKGKEYLLNLIDTPVHLLNLKLMFEGTC